MYRTWLHLIRGGLLALGVSAMLLCVPQGQLLAQDGGGDNPFGPAWVVQKHGVPLDIRSHGRMLGERIKTYGTLVTNNQQSVAPALPDLGFTTQVQVSQGGIQVNDGSLDHIMRLTGSAPWVLFTQSETTLAVFGSNIVAAYNTSVFQTTHSLFGTGFSNSTDGGQTWTSGFLPPIPGSSFTFGDPSLAVDRQGNFYATAHGLDATFRFTIQINKSTTGGATWSDAVVVQQDDGSDKPWMTIGPDPVLKNRDNVYVTWTSFQSTGTQLHFARSIDGGATWSTQILPVSNPKLPDKLSYSVPFVDASTGILYIPFLHFSQESFEQDFIRILKSTDGGRTFSFVNFNVSGAPDSTLLPIVPAGDVTDCGSSGGFRLTIHAGSDVGGGRNARPRFVQAARLIHQPAFAARNGSLYLAWLNANDAGGSDILFIQSTDGGQNWTSPIQVNPTVANDINHVLPTLAINEDPNDTTPPTIYISYYTQHSDGTVDVNTASARNGGGSFTEVRLTSAPFALAPTNVPLPTPQDPFNTVNFDNTFNSCYNLGEYMSAKVANGSSYVLWSDSRNMVTEPRSRFNPLSGQRHPQQDIFFEATPAR